MAEAEREGPSLEPPTLFGRRKSKSVAGSAPSDRSAPKVAKTERSAVTLPKLRRSRGTDPGAASLPPAAADESADLHADDSADPHEDESPPRAPGRYGALAVGLVVGTLLYGAGWAGIGTCRGFAADGCSTVPSVLIFVAVALIGVVVGALLLRLVGVPDPASTSLFAVAFASLVAFLFLTDHLDTWPMALIVPGMGAIAFFLSWWLTTSWTEADSI